MTDTTENTTQTPTEPEDDGLVEIKKKLVRFYGSFADGTHGYYYVPEDHDLFSETPLRARENFYIFFDGDNTQMWVNPAQIVIISNVTETDKILTFKIPKENDNEQNGTEAPVLAE